VQLSQENSVETESRAKATWTKGDTTWFGYPSNVVQPATIKQKTEKTCWAASLAIASHILGLTDLTEDSWVQLVMGGTPNTISSKLWAVLAKTLGTPITLEVLEASDVHTGLLVNALGQGHVILVHNVDHVVVLSAIGVGYLVTTFRVTDPATGRYETLDRDTFNGLDAKVFTIVRRS
jgi:ABC-type bacteriocin/lantibiotic exporter with double-glycine peptidase domain